MTSHPIPRQTLASAVTISGTGLFTSQPATITFKPGASGLTLAQAGIAVPVRSRALDPAPIHPAFAGSPARSTNLACKSARVATVEHALSALVGLGITDCDIELEGPEVPILDGSAMPFVSAIMQAGLKSPGTTVEPITITRPVTVGHHNATISATPRVMPGWSIAYTLDYGEGSPLGVQTAIWDGSPAMYVKAVAHARTFCMEHEAHALRRAGLFQSLTPADMLVIGNDGPIDNAYRMTGEPAAHKLLDAIGDLALAGRPIQADIIAIRSGHALNHKLAEALASTLQTAPLA